MITMANMPIMALRIFFIGTGLLFFGRRFSRLTPYPFYRGYIFKGASYNRRGNNSKKGCQNVLNHTLVGYQGIAKRNPPRKNDNKDKGKKTDEAFG